MKINDLNIRFILRFSTMVFKVLVDIISVFALSFVLSYCIGFSYAISLLYIALAACVVFLVRSKEMSNISWWKVFLLGFCILFLRSSFVWVLNTFPLDVPEKVVVTVRMPLDGFVGPFVKDFLRVVLIPCVILSLILISFFRKIIFCMGSYTKGLVTVVLVVLVVNALTLYSEVPVERYWNFFQKGSFANVLYHSEMWNENYVELGHVDAGDKTKNLIFIILESMENWPEVYIPEMYSLMNADWPNISFAEKINGGGYEIAGATTTFSSTVSKVTGIPFLVCYDLMAAKPTELNNAGVGINLSSPLNQLKSPLAKVKSVYDVLRMYGYRNVFLQGSDANFAGTRKFMITHGVDQVYDMNDFESEWDVNEFFRNFRSFSVGITDAKLYDISKSILDTLSKTKFSLTLTTIDTHFPYGFYDEKCKEKPKSRSEPDLFEATLKCASREIYEYVEWLKKQDYYDNTEIVIAGDHLFMGDLLTGNRERRLINIFINPSLVPSNKKREFSSIDMAPSILESLGFVVDNHKMGLGVSLFSDEKTLLEKYGWQKLNSEIEKLGCSLEYALQH